MDIIFLLSGFLITKFKQYRLLKDTSISPTSSFVGTICLNLFVSYSSLNKTTSFVKSLIETSNI